MNKGIVAGTLVLSLAAVFVVLPIVHSKPNFVEQTQNRLGSYLSSVYGPTTCSSSEVTEVEWAVKCTGGFKNKEFVFMTHLAEDEKGYKGAFYLTAKNENARNSTTEGLMKYLDIR